MYNDFYCKYYDIYHIYDNLYQEFIINNQLKLLFISSNTN